MTCSTLYHPPGQPLVKLESAENASLPPEQESIGSSLRISSGGNSLARYAGRVFRLARTDDRVLRGPDAASYGWAISCRSLSEPQDSARIRCMFCTKRAGLDIATRDEHRTADQQCSSLQRGAIARNVYIMISCFICYSGTCLRHCARRPLEMSTW